MAMPIAVERDLNNRQLNYLLKRSSYGISSQNYFAVLASIVCGKVSQFQLQEPHINDFASEEGWTPFTFVEDIYMAALYSGSGEMFAYIHNYACSQEKEDPQNAYCLPPGLLYTAIKLNEPAIVCAILSYSPRAHYMRSEQRRVLDYVHKHSESHPALLDMYDAKEGAGVFSAAGGDRTCTM